MLREDGNDSDIGGAESGNDTDESGGNVATVIDTNEDTRKVMGAMNKSGNAADDRFEVIEANEVAKLMCETIRKVTTVIEQVSSFVAGFSSSIHGSGFAEVVSDKSLFQESPTTVRMLLNHFKWDVEKLMEK